MIQPWWERWPGRLEHELELLRQAGIDAQVDGEAKSKGYIRISGTTTAHGQNVQFIASFPDVYPYTRFEVAAPDLALDRHQHPFSKTLCLIGRATTNWRTTDTLAEFLTTRVPTLVPAAAPEGTGEIREPEEQQGEPYSDYYQYPTQDIVLIDSTWELPTGVPAGRMQIGFGKPTDESPSAILSVSDTTDAKLVAAAPAIMSRFSEVRVPARWIRVDAPIPAGNPNEFLETLIRIDPRLRQPRWRRLDRTEVDIVGVVFPEETQYRTIRDGWIFLVRKRLKGKTKAAIFFVRAGRAGDSDLEARIPTDYHALRKASIAIVGVGCIGAPSALELARLGVGNLLLVDEDIVDAATVRRWPLGLGAAGHYKVDALSRFISEHYPHTTCETRRRRIGRVLDGRESDLSLLELIAGCDLIYDATAEPGINYLLADIAREQQRPYIAIATTPGGWGGRVSRILPNSHGCWLCFQRHLEEETIPPPPFDPSGEFQPEGCADPTFIAANIDTSEIALAGTRLAALTLGTARGATTTDYDWDVGILSMRGDTGRRLLPHWETFPLLRHEECPGQH